MASLVESGKYVAINTTGTITNGFYRIVFTSEAYILQYHASVIICPSIVVLSCSEYASDVNMIT